MAVSTAAKFDVAVRVALGLAVLMALGVAVLMALGVAAEALSAVAVAEWAQARSAVPVGGSGNCVRAAVRGLQVSSGSVRAGTAAGTEVAGPGVVLAAGPNGPNHDGVAPNWCPSAATNAVPSRAPTGGNRAGRGCSSAPVRVARTRELRPGPRASKGRCTNRYGTSRLLRTPKRCLRRKNSWR